ncbi:Zn(II)2Cys6 transcription factor domain-containing protein [Aspergillus alliaceus]|uniref:Zn(II)2Cys6 transcription factor domain-containing protein n=1 Tax=Petromyces alliaceus TaxID=209559 RepID=UPI0012A3D3E1|nr:uncharacterized protein BDW43DRAFT_315599 [Aspergillus alliaceus]KAB8228832.1 hypothetical protein BDW43DRAFT_315599 [Aspergillus alliaceus]
MSSRTWIKPVPGSLPSPATTRPILDDTLASLPVIAGSTASMNTSTMASTDDPPLRNSCDSCNAAKVKCSRDRPSCHRCQSRKLCCVYGVSLRGIKRARHKPNDNNFHRSPSLQEPFSPSTISSIPGELLQDWDYTFPTSSFPNKNIDIDTHFTLTNPLLADSSSLLGFAPLPTALATPPSLSTPTSSTSIFGATCCCQKTIAEKLADLGTRTQLDTVPFDEFLITHKASMAVCISVLECTSPHHKRGILLLVELTTLLIHILEAFEQVMSGFDTEGRQSRTSVRLSLGSYQLDHAEEKVLQANLLRIELTKFGAIIQNLNQQYSNTANGSRAGDICLVSPLLADLKKKARAKFDATREWAPCL